MNYSNIKYMHIERLGTEAVEDLLVGKVYIFPKIDGTNGVVWFENGEVHGGSRKRELSIESDNAGFFAYIRRQDNIKSYLTDHPDRILYGEWLVPHTLKTYRDDCWRKFYVFDVGVMGDDGRTAYLSYDQYSAELETYQIEYLPPITIVGNPTIEFIRTMAESNHYLMQPDCIGEGVVCKNYYFTNKYGHQIWGKLVRNEFKETHIKMMGCPEVEFITVEADIVNGYVTKSLVDKEFDKIRTTENGWNSKLIPRLLNTVYHTLIVEETWNFIKEFKSPKVDFKRLQKLAFAKVRELRPDIFGGGIV